MPRWPDKSSSKRRRLRDNAVLWCQGAWQEMTCHPSTGKKTCGHTHNILLPKFTWTPRPWRTVHVQYNLWLQNTTTCSAEICAEIWAWLVPSYTGAAIRAQIQCHKELANKLVIFQFVPRAQITIRLNERKVPFCLTTQTYSTVPSYLQDWWTSPNAPSQAKSLQ